MSSIRKRFEVMRRVLEGGSSECTLDAIPLYCIQPIQYILDLTRGQNPEFRCCVTDYRDESGTRRRACDSYDFPLQGFKRNCDLCASDIEKELPRLIALYEQKVQEQGHMP